MTIPPHRLHLVSKRAHRVYEVIERGCCVAEPELAHKTGLKPTALVEALLELESEGFIKPTHWGLRR